LKELTPTFEKIGSGGDKSAEKSAEPTQEGDEPKEKGDKTKAKTGKKSLKVKRNGVEKAGFISKQVVRTSY